MIAMARRRKKKSALLGMAIGATRTVVALANPDGEVLAESCLESWTSGSWQKDLETLVSHAQILIRGAGLTATQVNRNDGDHNEEFD